MQSIVHSVGELRQDSPTRLIVDRENSMDLTSSGSMLVAGKTRSGKTTGIIALLLAVLLQGPDEYESEVIIIDPKRADLSRLPHVVTVTPEGDAQAVIAALKRFATAIVKRQHFITGADTPFRDFLLPRITKKGHNTALPYHVLLLKTFSMLECGHYI